MIKDLVQREDIYIYNYIKSRDSTGVYETVEKYLERGQLGCYTHTCAVPEDCSQGKGPALESNNRRSLPSLADSSLR